MNLDLTGDFASIKPGDKITVRTPQGQLLMGFAQMLLTNPDEGTVVLNMGGKHGRPLVCTPANFVRIARRKA